MAIARGYLWSLSMRRLLAIALLLVVIGATAWTLWQWRATSAITADPWNAVPARSAIIVEVPDAWTTWDKFTHTSQLWSAVERSRSAAAVGRIMGRTMERAENDAALRNALADVDLLIALARSGNNTVDALLAFKPNTADAVPVNALAELLHADEASMKAVQRGEVVRIEPDTALPSLSLTVQNGIWLLATSSTMMDEALLQLKSGRPIMQDSTFATAQRTLGAGSDAHLLVHLERARSLLHTWWPAETIDALPQLDGWAALDVRARPDAILLSGLLTTNAPDAMITTLSEQGTGRNDLSRWLPADVVEWDVREVTDAERMLITLGHASETDRAELGPGLLHWVNGSMGVARSSAMNGVAASAWGVFQTDDVEAAREGLSGLCGDGVRCDTANYRGTRLTRLGIPDAHERLLGPHFSFLQQPWWCVLGDVVVCASDQPSLYLAVDAWNDGRTLAEDERTTSWTDRIASTAARTIRWDLARGWGRIAEGAKPEVRSALTEQQGLWERLGGFSLQLSPAQRGRSLDPERQCGIAIGLQHAPMEQRESSVLWSTPLGSTGTRRPDIVRNHTNNTLEVLVQDAEHRLHLLGSSGRKLWSYPLDEPILGEVHQVDRFKNGKLQLLFNTAGRIFLIDRNGKDVGGFPVKLAETASGPLAVFDYDMQRDYRVLVPTSGGSVLNYGLEGTLVTGWEMPRSPKPSTNAVLHVRIGNKDHLLVIGGDGEVKILDRRGSVRGSSTLQLGPDPQVITVVPGVDLMSTRLLWNDSTGGLHEGRLNGQKTVLAKASGGYLSVGQVADDGMHQVVRIVGDSLQVIHHGKVEYTKTFGSPLYHGTALYHFGGGTALGILLPEREQVTLVDDRGQELEGLPLRGTALFSIADLDLDGTLEMVTVLSDGHVTAYHALPTTSAER